MAETPMAPAMVRRYERRTSEPDDTTYDIIWIDRTTGAHVLSYDGADPANTSPAYGAPSDEECFKRRGLDIDEEVDASLCVVPIPPGEAERHVAAKARKVQRDQEEAESLDLLDLLGNDAEAFDFRQWSAGEIDILAPALKKRGYTNIQFYMGEQDSFGPLSRGVVATCQCGKRVRFYYG